MIISEKVANELGFNWFFVEYNEQTIDQDFPQCNEFQKYYKFASNHVSIFYTQDYFAVKYLHDNKIINNDAIFATGHSGDYLAGSFFSRSEIANRDNIIDVIFQKQDFFKTQKIGLCANKSMNLLNMVHFDYKHFNENTNFKNFP